ncbi:NUDIX hydrolase [Methylobacterium sp. J-001]|uniref:NUDIX hydrolase n=1 Tax=Methylobacterium sp. J-001 TaxID=2836609 RepID=UPI001FB94AC5|nr:NUDIX hydrolase [Methylobacterium sp. J-001]MCJ2120611.1 NUDIX hydrolase [Methylobacterium sp. J-001]
MSDKAWTVTQSRYVLRDRWLTVRADYCVTSRGVVLAPYYVVERPDFVAVLAIDRDDHVILVRQYRHGLRTMSLELPGGVMDAGEVDPMAVAQRELVEETGYRDGRFRLLVTLGVQPASASNRAHLVLAEGVVPGLAHPEACEDITVVRVAREEARALAISGAILNAKHVGFLLLGLARLENGA